MSAFDPLRTSTPSVRKRRYIARSPPIVRDVSKRLSDIRYKVSWADWRMAPIATQAAHPDWFKHGDTMESLEPLLREAGVDMSEPVHLRDERLARRTT
jgi:hypothetical protein